MAIDFLNNVSLNKNELRQARIENQTSDANAGTGVEGQLYFNTIDDVLRVWAGGTWTSVSGDITEVQASTTASLLGISVVDATGPIPKIGIDINGSDALGGTANAADTLLIYDSDVAKNKKITVANLVAAAPQGDITAVTVTSPITGGGTSGSIAIGHANQANTPTTDATTLAFGATFDVYTDVTTNATGHVTDHEITTFTLPSSPVTSITGGTDITITGTAAVPVINQTAITRSDSTSTASPAAGATFTAVDSVTSSTTGNITALNLKTITLPADTNDNTTYTLPTTNGNNPDIVLTGSDSSTDIININGTSTTVKVTGSGTNTLGFDLVDDVTIVNDLTIGGEFTASGTGQSSFGGQVTIPTTPSAGTDAASKSYVDSLVAGGLTFKDGFNAGTGALDGGGNLTTGATRVALEVGDFYVVTTAGSFYGSVTLDVGDSVIAKLAAAAGTSDINDWVIIQGDEGVVTFTNSNGGTYVAYGSTNTGAIGAVTIGDVDLTAVDGTSTTTTKFLSKDNTWDVPSYTTNTDATYAIQADAKSGSSVPLTLNGSNGGADTTVNLTEGANITLTRNSATEITIASTDTGALGDRVALTGGSTAGGLTTFAYTVTSSFAGAVALDVKCEVITAAGQTVYADITRSGTTLNVIFAGTVADSDYEALLTYVG